MEKRVVLAIVLCVAISLGWIWWRSPTKPPVPAPRQGTAAVTPPVAAHGPGDPPLAPKPEAPVEPPPAPQAGGPPVAAPVSQIPETRTVLDDGLRTLDLSSRGGGSIKVLELWVSPYLARGDRSVDGNPAYVTVAPGGRPGALSVGVIGDPTLAGLDLDSWNAEPTAAGGMRYWIERGGLKIEKILEFGKKPEVEGASSVHHYDMTVRVTNVSRAPGADLITVLRGPWTPHFQLHIPEDGLVLATAGDTPEQLLPDDVAKTLLEPGHAERLSEHAWRYIAVRADFHVAFLAPQSPLPPNTAVSLSTVKLEDPKGPTLPPWTSASAAFQIPFKVPAIGGSVEWTSLFYAGPDSRAVLNAPPYTPYSDVFPNRGLWILSFGPINRALAWLLQLLASTGMGYGLAVCSLTVLVRGILFPLSKKSQVSMKVHSLKMARVKPRLDAVKLKYKDNPKKLNEETMRVMKEEQLSFVPGGCLLAFCQMPIWISLYGTLQTHFEMRHASFLWINDLTTADHFMALPFAAHWPIIGGWLNIMPFLMMATWLGSSMMQPLPDDPEQRSQAKIMRYIPLLFGVFMYSTASGLTLYMTLSALWSIGESWFIRRRYLAPLQAQAALATVPAPSLAPAPMAAKKRR